MSSTPSLASSCRRASLTLLLSGALAGISVANWDAAPLDVHEWGVNTFDWNDNKRLLQELPDYLYTDKRPGTMMAPPNPRVRDLPADSGIRTKPLLYFYPGKRHGRGSSEALIGIELQFAYGYPNAWWPQVTNYHPPDLANPEDEKMQLVWEKLTLHAELPADLTLPGKDLPDDHWTKLAREVDAAYVSNGKEAERYVFYEGKTREEPAITLLPAHGGAHHNNYGRDISKERKEVAVINVSKHPIYDVIAVYRNHEKGILWTSHVSELLPRVAALRIPDFSQPREEDNLKVSPEVFRRQTTGRLLDDLTTGIPFDSGNVFMRNPADPQPPTLLHQLFMKEAIGLEKIWHDDFFDAEGLTVIYRESPAYLDEAMPLNIYTSMYWHIKLSRCGLVLNRNLPLDEVYPNDEAFYRFQLAHWNAHMKEDLKKVEPQLRKNRFLSIGQARYLHNDDASAKINILKNTRDLFE